MPPKGGKKGGHHGSGGGGGAQFSASDEARLEALMAKYESGDAIAAANATAGSNNNSGKGSKKSASHNKSSKGGEAAARKVPEVFAPKVDAEMVEAAKARQVAHEALIAKILAVQGESGVQEALRLEVIKTKKAESDVLHSKKNVNAAVREHDLIATEVSKMERIRLTLEKHCEVLVSENTRIREETVKRVEEDQINRDGIREKIMGEMDRLSGKLQDEDDNHEKAVEENKVLRVQFDEMKATFDEQFSKYEEDWKMRDAQTNLLLKKTQAQVQKTDAAQAEYTMNEKQLTQYIEGTQGLKGQYELFSAKLGEFEGAAVQQEDVASLTAKQMDTLKTRLADAEKVKVDSLERKRTLDQQTTMLRQKAKGMKTKVQAAERAKVQADAKCREAYAKAAKDKESKSSGTQ